MPNALVMNGTINPAIVLASPTALMPMKVGIRVTCEGTSKQPSTMASARPVHRARTFAST